MSELVRRDAGEETSIAGRDDATREDEVVIAGGCRVQPVAPADGNVDRLRVQAAAL